MICAHIQGVGIVGPGIADWRAAMAVMQGESPYVAAATALPPPDALPPAERRRAGRLIRLALAVGSEAVASAGADARALPSVFSSSGGDGDNCQEICVALASNERLLSPTRFHNSVHNVGSGYWSIAYGCREPSTALCAYDGSFGAGLLEALSQLTRTHGALLLVTYDLDYPPPLHWKRPIPDAFGIALLLSYGPSLRALAHVSVSFTTAPATPMSHPELEALRQQIPSARGLPLLECLARGRSASVALDYLDGQRLLVEVTA